MGSIGAAARKVCNIFPVFALVFLAIGGTAAAATDVIVDPGGPAGRVYAIPLEHARQLGAGLDTGGGAATQVTRETRGASKAPPAFGAESASLARGGRTARDAGAQKGVRRSVDQVSNATYSAGPLLAGLTIGVLLLGLLVGLAVRRLGGRQPRL